MRRAARVIAPASSTAMASSTPVAPSGTAIREPGRASAVREISSTRCAPPPARVFSAWERGGTTEPTIIASSRSEEHTSELQSRGHLVCRLLLEKKNENTENKSKNHIKRGT